MIVEGTKSFVTSINRLGKSEAQKAKAFIRAFCTYLKTTNNVIEISNMPLSDFILFQEDDEDLKGQIGADSIYRVAFDNFDLFISISGKMPKKCTLLYLKSS